MIKISVATLLRASFFERPCPMNFCSSTVAPTVCMIFGVTPTEPRSEYCVHGLMTLRSMTGCIVTLLGGNSLRIFGAFGDVCFGSVTTPATPATTGSGYKSTRLLLKCHLKHLKKLTLTFGIGISNPSASHSLKSLCKAKLASCNIGTSSALSSSMGTSSFPSAGGCAMTS